MRYTKKQITVQSKLYGYWLADDKELSTRRGGVEIRSESNPSAKVYLKPGSPRHQEVLAAIRLIPSDNQSEK